MLFLTIIQFKVKASEIILSDGRKTVSEMYELYDGGKTAVFI